MKGNYYLSDPFLASMIMGGSVTGTETILKANATMKQHEIVVNILAKNTHFFGVADDL